MSESARILLCCYTLRGLERYRLLCQLAQKARGSLHQILMGRVPSRPMGGQVFQFLPTQHFLANNLCNTCRNIQLQAPIWLYPNQMCHWQRGSEFIGPTCELDWDRGSIKNAKSFRKTYHTPACLAQPELFFISKTRLNLINIYVLLFGKEKNIYISNYRLTAFCAVEFNLHE